MYLTFEVCAKTHLTLAEVYVDAGGFWRFVSGDLSTPECEVETKCLLRLLEFENDFWQGWQINFETPSRCTLSICAFKWSFLENARSHFGHRTFCDTWPCTVVECFWRSLSLSKNSAQRWQENFSLIFRQQVNVTDNWQNRTECSRLSTAEFNCSEWPSFNMLHHFLLWGSDDENVSSWCRWCRNQVKVLLHLLWF